MKSTIAATALFFIAMLVALHTEAQKPVKIHGTVNFHSPYSNPIIQLYKVENGQYVPLQYVKADSTRKFALTFIPEYKGFYVLGHGTDDETDKKYKFYFRGGEVLQLTMNNNDYLLTGNKNSRENKILAEWFKLSTDIVNYIFNTNLPDETLKTRFSRITQFADANIDWFKDKKTGNKDFDELMSYTVPFDIQCKALDYLSKPFVKPTASDYAGTLYEKINVALLTADTTILRMPFGLSTLHHAANLPYIMKNASFMPDIENELSNITNNRLKSLVLTHYLLTLTSFGTIELLQEKYAECFSTSDICRLEEYKNKFREMIRDMSGQDFTGTDINGKEIKLSDFRGKLVVMDFWSTTCGVCIASFPEFREAEKHYRDNDGVVFLTVTTDQVNNREKWEKVVKEKSVPGINIFPGGRKNIPESYRIFSIPRIIIIDRSGQVLDPYGPDPGTEMFDTLITRYLEK